MRALWLVLGLAGCPWVGGGRYDQDVRDLDGDGGIAERFGGPDCLDGNPEIADCDDDGDGYRTVLAGGDDCDDANGSIHPGAPERCDQVDNDCDGAVDNADPDVVVENRFFVDADGDGDGDPGEVRACQEYGPGSPPEPVFVTNDDDCDDGNAFVSTDATEVCDGIDNNCDGVTDDVGTWFVDADGDGFGDPDLQSVGACDLSTTTGLSAVGTDCDDGDDSIYPGADEGRYDGVDSNCNGGLDDWDADLDGYVPAEHWAAAEAANLLLPTAQQWDISQGDCDDFDPRRFEGNPEVCDGVDNDCDERVDVEDLEGVGPTEELALRGEVQAVFADHDGDGHFGTPLTLCPADVDGALHSFTDDDCYDGGDAGPYGAVDPALVHDDAPEICDGVDNDCDGRADWAFDTFGTATEHYVDGDGDGYGADRVYACGVLPAAGIVAAGDDCNDGDSSTFPGAPEVCGDIVRQDCSSASVWDCDADGQEGDYQGNGSGEDCDDEDDAIYATDAPAFEICDGIDNDCDGLVDSADTGNLDTSTLAYWYPDLDEDGWGADTENPIQQCDPPSQYAAPRPGDCDDSNPDLNPDTPWFFDADGDGYGPNSSMTVADCAPPDDGPWVRLGGDCNDLDPVYNPLTLWYPDLDGDFVGNPAGAEQFCSPPAGTSYVLASAGQDCNDDDPDVLGTSTWYADADNDGWGDDTISTQSCARPVIGQVQFVIAPGDCDDTDTTVNPLQTESCNAVDDDCDGLVDDLDPNLVAAPGGPRGYLDADGDGTGRSDVVKDFCVALPPGWAAVSGDCEDGDPAIYPGAVEICGNGIDDDCAEGEQIPVWYVDADDDGFGAGAASAPSCDPPVGYSATTPGDCNDDQALTYPGAPERDACDTIDDNCDGQPEPRLTWYFDQDRDGFGDDAEQVTTCVPPTAPPAGATGGEWVLSGGDCDDLDASITFGRLWYVDGDGDGLGNDTAAFFDCPVYDGGGAQLSSFLLVDANGNGTYDDGDTAASIFAGDCDDANPIVGLARGYRVDADGDGWGSSNVAEVVACPTASGNPPAGLVTRSGDCVDVPDDDQDTLVPPELINPEQLEILDDFADNDCDGFTDQIGGGITWFEDADGDGLGGSALASYEPGAVTNGQDCDDGDATIANGLYLYDDADGDGFGRGSAVFAAGVCTVPAGKSLFGGDCDDQLGAIRPGATETCDGVDQDCDGIVDDGVSTAGFADTDDDGHGDPDAPGFFCATERFVANLDNGADCDDDDAAISPSAVEVCDGIDNNCADGIGDEAVPLWYLDDDGDTVGSNTSVIQACQQPGPEWLATNGDCDDGDPAIGPGATETCNGIDDDCDGTVDEGFTLFTAYRDEDGDGAIAAGSMVEVCAVPVGYTTTLGADDCDDSDARVAPGLAEVCGDGLDNDCANGVDDASIRYVDADEDGFGWPFAVELAACDSPVHADVAGDCDDTAAGRNPLAPETVCNGVDDDCDNAIDEDAVSGLTTWFRDLDGDTFGDAAHPLDACVQPEGYVQTSTDCDDLRLSAYPDATELCNGLDDDCDGAVEPTTTWYADLDRDGYRSETESRTVCDSEQPPAFYDRLATVAIDCDDLDTAINPDADEVCGDGIDNDCDTDVDEEGLRYPDGDLDGFGSGTPQLRACILLSFSDVDTDCDDGAADVNPGIATDLCDGIDADCDGQLDEDATFLTYYVDGDADGYGISALSFQSCDGGAGGATVGGDCDDGRASVKPGATEVCNGLDDDCIDGVPANEVDGDGDGFLACQETNDGDPNDTPNAPTWYADADGDGFGDDAVTLMSVTNPGPGWTQVSGDCNDDDASMSPGVAFELCDGKDNNCDGAELWVDGSFQTFDVSNPLSGAVSQGAGMRFLHDHDGDGTYSGDRLVTSCFEGLRPSAATLEIDGTSVALQELDLTDPTAFLPADDCVNGSTASIQARDTDGDTVPALASFADVRFVCDGSTPTAPWSELTLGTALDCAPSDPSRAELVTTGGFADVDGDGAVSLFPVEGACVVLGGTQTTPGIDCDDDDPTTTDVLADAVTVTTSAELDAYLGTCRAGTFELGTGITSLSITVPDDGEVTLVGSGANACDETTTMGCISTDVTVGRDGGLTLVGLGLNGSITAPDGGRVVVADSTVRGGPIEQNGGFLELSNVLLVPTDDVTGTVVLTDVDAALSGVRLVGSGGQDGIVATGGQLFLDDVDLSSLAKAFELVDVVFEGSLVKVGDSTSPFDLSGALLDGLLTGVEVENSGVSKIFDGFFVCEQCSFRTPTGTVFRLQNTVAHYPTLSLYQPVVDGDANTSGPVFEVNGANATFEAFGLDFDVTPGRAIVQANGGSAYVYDTYLSDYPTSFEAPFQATEGGFLHLGNVGGDTLSLLATGETAPTFVKLASSDAEIHGGNASHFGLSEIDGGSLQVEGFELSAVTRTPAAAFISATVDLQRTRVHIATNDQYVMMQSTDLTLVESLLHSEDPFATGSGYPFELFTSSSLVSQRSTIYGPGLLYDGTFPLFFIEQPGSFVYLDETVVDAGSGYLYEPPAIIQTESASDYPVIFDSSWIDYEYRLWEDSHGVNQIGDYPTDAYSTGPSTYDAETYQTNALIRLRFGEPLP